MQVRAGAEACRAHQADLLATLDLVAFFDVETVEVAIPGLVARPMADDDQATVAVGVPVRRENLAVVRGDHGRALRGGDVEAAVAARRQSAVDLAKVGGDFASRGPHGVELA